eukprot:CAMPEP_0203745196 /NCGR_PEP_ID=MMETSP0098-20131031/1012_1 /ASSEMBLY_ACC=CAM_ASM_000208 /TAXON_ID=96639 /ORGANISM=" , Strain NY0313808BC1" /LENGTH=145 /DNA_ID=CAMNT_0050632907 /DNA_START=1314 /DNA_END=1751 /DNA_ORIENTATION=+
MEHEFGRYKLPNYTSATLTHSLERYSTDKTNSNTSPIGCYHDYNLSSLAPRQHLVHVKISALTDKRYWEYQVYIWEHSINLKPTPTPLQLDATTITTCPHLLHVNISALTDKILLGIPSMHLGTLNKLEKPTPTPLQLDATTITT